MEVEGEWSLLVENLAEELVFALSKKLKKGHYDRIQTISAPSEKLVYLHLVDTEPQSFVSVRRALDLDRRTVDRALKGLMEKGYVVQDERYLYWLMGVDSVEVRGQFYPPP